MAFCKLSGVVVDSAGKVLYVAAAGDGIKRTNCHRPAAVAAWWS